MIRLIVGPPCAGKSTYIAKHKKEGDIIYDFDALCNALGSTGHDHPQYIRAVVAQLKPMLFDIFRITDKDVWLHKAYVSQSFIDSFPGAEVVYLNPGFDVCLERAEKRGHPTVGALQGWFDTHSWILRKYK